MSKIATAEVLGTLAFKAGKPRIPALDKDLLALLAGHKVGEGIPVLNAWLRNWDLANLAASG